jgi:iron complex outermembrane recepter protein
VISDPTLPFITVWDYEAGVKFDEARFSVDAALFRMDVSNEQSFDPALNTVVGGGQSRRNGLDVSARAPIAQGVTSRIDFTILHGFYTNFVDPNDNVNYTGMPIFNTSKYVGSASLDWAPSRAQWFGEFGGSMEGPYTPFEEQGIVRPAYLLLNGSVGYRIRSHTEVTVSARNLLGAKYRELESGGQATPGQSRSVYAGLRYRFD